MPSSFLSKFVKQPSSTSQSGSPYKGPSPSASKRSLRSHSSSNLSSQELPKPSDAPEVPKFLVTDIETGGEIVPAAESPATRNSSPVPPNNSESRHRRAFTLAADDRDLPTPRESEFRMPDSARNRTTSVSTHISVQAATPPISRPTSEVIMADINDPDNTLNGIVESPEPIKPVHVDEPVSPQVLAQSDRETDAVSLASSSGKKKRAQTSQPWRSGTTSKKSGAPPRKPSGIAGALAASGLAMANHAGTMSVPHSIQQSLPPAPQTKNRPGSFALASASLSTFPRTPSDTQSRHRDASMASLASAASVNSNRTRRSDNDDDDSDGYDSPDLDLNDDDIPVTGFAVASNKRNADFHELFKAIPEGDYLIDDYGCALQREILIQGRMYISENHVCFHANIFGWITDLTVPMYDIISLEKKMTAYVIPNAIQVTTRKAKYSFASFLARDTVFDVMHNIWRTARPDVSSIDGISARASLEEVAGSSRLSVDGLPGAGLRDSASKKVTQCECSKKGEHYSEKCLECVLPGTPDKVYTLMFQSAFMKEFMREEQKLQDIQISDWCPAGNDPKLLARNMSYIKPLTGSIGPRQTKCEIHDETVHLDFEDFVSTVTTTRTPDVPSGGVFSVKTRTCLMWASNNSTRVIVTTTIEWTGRSFIKAVIERSALEGQRTYHQELERHLKQYISKHITEFLPEGASAVVEEAVATTVESPTENLAAKMDETRRSPDRRGLQWALDTFTGAYKVGKQSASGAIELLKDAWDTSSGTSMLYALIAVLILSNIYTFLMVGKREEIGRRKAEGRKIAEREQWIGDTVKVLLQEIREAPRVGTPEATSPTSAPLDHSEEVFQIRKSLDELEDRVRSLRKLIKDDLD